MKQLSIILAIILSSFWSFGQNDSLIFYGNIYDDYDNVIEELIKCRLFNSKKSDNDQIFYSDSSGYFDFKSVVDTNKSLYLKISVIPTKIFSDDRCPEQTRYDLYTSEIDNINFKDRIHNDSIKINGKVFRLHSDRKYPCFYYQLDSTTPTNYNEVELNELICSLSTNLKYDKNIIEISVNTIWNEDDNILQERANYIVNN